LSRTRVEEGKEVEHKLPRPVLQTERGYLYHGDCLEIMPLLESNSIDVFFADPPFNLQKITALRSTMDWGTPNT
jgi:site-specific DNA-methyltransferase (adenine-specific)